MADGLYNSQDIAIQSCLITGSSGQALDFKNMVVEFSYYEDIFSSFISGNMLISDSMGYINILELSGGEIISVKFDKPGFDDPIQKNFMVNHISNRTTTRGTNENYIINFYSNEVFLHEQYRITKSYQQMLLSGMISDICKTHLKIPNDKLFIDKSSGLRDIVIPNFKPFQAINWLTSLAVSDDHKNIGSPYLFYENRDGFNFKSALNLFQNNVYNTYEYSAKGLRSQKNGLVTDIDAETKNVIKYEHITNFNLTTAIKSGVFANKMHTVDPLRLKLGESDFNYTKYIKQASSLNQHPMPISDQNRFGDTVDKTPGVVKFCISSTGQSENKYIKNKQLNINENRIETNVPYRTAQLALFCMNRMKIMIPGDVYMTIGRVIQFNLPEIVYNDSSKKKKNDEYYSGKYLVTAVRHLFNQENRFVTVLEICKESFPSQYASYNNSASGWGSVR